MVALCNRADHYIFILWLLLYSFFFPCRISAVGDWMSTILSHMVWPSVNLEYRSEMCCTQLAENTGRKKVAKNRHLGTIAQLCQAISSQLRHISTTGKNLLSSSMSFRCPPQYGEHGELRPTSGWDPLASLGHPTKFQLVSRLGSVTAWHVVVGVSQTLRRWIEGATYVRQGDHHVGHWPTFLVVFSFTRQCGDTVGVMCKFCNSCVEYTFLFPLVQKCETVTNTQVSYSPK